MKSGRQRQRQREVVVGGEKFSLFRRGGNKISFFCSMSSQMAVLSWRGQATPASFISSSQHCLHLFGCLSIHLRSPSSSSLPLYDVPHKKKKKKRFQPSSASSGIMKMSDFPGLIYLTNVHWLNYGRMLLSAFAADSILSLSELLMFEKFLKTDIWTKYVRLRP